MVYDTVGVWLYWCLDRSVYRCWSLNRRQDGGVDCVVDAGALMGVLIENRIVEGRKLVCTLESVKWRCTKGMREGILCGCRSTKGNSVRQ